MQEIILARAGFFLALRHVTAMSMVRFWLSSGSETGACERASAMRWVFPGTQLTLKL